MLQLCLQLVPIAGYGDWEANCSLRLVSHTALGLVPHPFVALARQHYCAADGRGCTEAEAQAYFRQSRSAGTELVEAAVLQQLASLAYAPALTFGNLYDVLRNSPQCAVLNVAHASVARAVACSRCALLANCDREPGRPVIYAPSIAVGGYSDFMTTVQTGAYLQQDAQIGRLVHRTGLPLGYAFVFANCVLWYRALATHQRLPD